ncbi:hypothetical protein H0G86_000375 [Trichoderma simmonsii]|uniref:Uncharacterized protein n=1 Tax=Trichoderma simmonsii TaxID=1491479 RepID=A0A8G0P874_9HYPO|nr:hypothetical protein H0G86_000375 [Trichoderma simmonsii]
MLFLFKDLVHLSRQFRRIWRKAFVGVFGELLIKLVKDVGRRTGEVQGFARR